MNTDFKHLSLLALLCASTGVGAAESFLVPPGEQVADVSQEEWSRNWWQWAGSFGYEESPIADKIGAHCGAKQSGAVWFLAGTYGTKRTVRECAVPRGKYLFFPLINYVVMPPVDRQVNCKAVMSSAAQMTDHVSSLVLEIDGVRHADLAAHRLSTRQCFDTGARAEPKIAVYPSAANGYYVMIPLPPGKHTLNFGGALPSMLQAVTYVLTVE